MSSGYVRGKTHHSWWQSLRLQARKQPAMAMLNLYGRQKSPHEHQGREPFQAKDIAEDWFLQLRGKHWRGELLSERTFKDAAEQFEREYEVITEGERSPKWIIGHKARIRLHLMPFFGEMGLSTITAGQVQEYRIHRLRTKSTSKAPSRSTMHDEVVTLRQILKTALRHNWLAHLPDLSPPYKTNSKSVTAHGFQQRNISSSTLPREKERRTLFMNAIDGMRSSSTILCCSWPIPACVPMRPRIWNTVMLR